MPSAPVTVLPDISLRQLEYLVAVADATTWAVAAAEVGVSASALSQGLAELERRVGVELFERDGRRRLIRPAARPVLDHARQVVALTHDLVAWSDRVRSARTGRVRLGMIDVAAVVHFPGALAAFRADRPAVELVLTVAPSAVLVEQLRAGELDLVVCVAPPDVVVGVTAEPLLDEPLVVYAPHGASIDDPERWGPWVLFPADSHTRRQVERALVERGATVRIAAESHQPDVLRQMVELGLGWTVLPAVQGLDHAVVGPEVAVRRLVLLRRDSAVADPAVDALAAVVRGAGSVRRRDA